MEEGSRIGVTQRKSSVQKESRERGAVDSSRMEEGALRRGMGVASRGWKRQGNRPRVSRKEHSSSNILILACRTILDFLLSEL